MRSFTIFLRLLSMQQCFNKSDVNIRLCRTQHPRFRPSLLNFPAFLQQGDKLMFSSGQKHHHACFFNLISCRKYNSDNNHLEVEIVSKDCVKPSAPTPQHLRMYEVSIFDQLIPHIYMPFIYLYSNDHQNDSNLISLNDLTLKRKQLLKGSLSKILTRFYPLAGKVKDYRHIDCNDEGVYCVEAKVNNRLSDFLREPGKQSLEPLLPFGSNTKELLSQTYVLMIQLTTFSCGGISIGLCASHKIIDGYSYATFLKAWAATALASSEDICPKFVSPSIFLSTPTLVENASLFRLGLYLKQGKRTTKRFVFCASSLAQLKRKGGASRVLGVTGLIWKHAIKALKARSTTTNDCIKKSSALTTTVNLRERSLPPLPQYSMGNIVWASLLNQRWEDTDFGLDSLVQRIKNSNYKINGDLVESLKGDKGSQKMGEYLNEANMFYSDENAEYILITSMCNTGMYEVNFGWGKPIWVSSAPLGKADPNMPQLTNFVVLMDTRYGNGVEAWVTLSDDDMAIFERDPELLEMASVDPSPLE